MNRLIIVSNRLPVTVKISAGKPEVVPSSGGLSTGLKGPHEKSGGLWIGWPGDLGTFNESQKEKIYSELDDLRLVPVELSSDEIESYYERFSNGVIWPLFHYLLHLTPYKFDDWGTYVEVNRKFADKVAEQYRPGDMIWVHDYQLFLVPAFIRQRIPDAKIGFFLHIPFPTSEVFRILPPREEILAGILGADVIGFHTYSYMRHFSSCLVRISGKEPAIDQVYHDGRHISLGIFPISIDTEKFNALSKEPEVLEEASRLKSSSNAEFIILGVDRLDYTKGIRRRLLAFQRFLELHPEYRGRVRMIQIAVPTREKVGAYEEFRNEVNRIVSEINGQYGTVNSTPLQYLYQSFDVKTIAALYCACNVMLVTPLRDGMNLVAKEFVACRSDNDGVLILSEFAGASAELGEAITVNPYDIEEVAESIFAGLTMPKKERSIRMNAMRERVFSHDVHAWAGNFIDAMDKIKEEDHTEKMFDVNDLYLEIKRRSEGKNLYFMLDYDGTLVGFQKIPDLAVPGEKVMSLLKSLLERNKTYVSIISGRKRETLGEWFGEVKALEIYAEHGLWERIPNNGWKELIEIKTDWKEHLRPLLDLFSRSTPGTFIEEKSASLAWHYRAAEKEYGLTQARELMIHLLETYSNMPVQVLQGNKVIEIRMQGVHKGLAVEQLLKEVKEPSLIVCIGDDHTDEDMFEALPAGAVSIRVGRGESIANFRLPDFNSVHDLLNQFIVKEG